MDQPSVIPVTSLQTGVTHEERSFEWKIVNFPDVIKQRSLMESQLFEFYAGDSIGMTSKWVAHLSADEEKDGKTSVGFYIGLREGPKPIASFEHLYAQLIFIFKNKDGVVKKEFVTDILDWYDKKLFKLPESSYGFPKMFNMKGPLPSYMELVDGSLVVHITFKLFTQINATRPLSARLKEFQVNSKAKARADLARLVLGNPAPSNEVRIIAKDKVEFKMQKGILSARSPVFQAMMDADMREGNAGVIEIQDMGSTTLKTMLHFLNQGKLLPEWKQGEVLVELTNAAAKYQLLDLLHFLDGALGSVCTLDNVGALLPLASRLSLKKAEEELLSFLRRNGAISVENFLQVFNGMLALESNCGEASLSDVRLGRRNAGDVGWWGWGRILGRRRSPSGAAQVKAPKSTRGTVRK